MSPTFFTDKKANENPKEMPQRDPPIWLSELFIFEKSKNGNQ